MENDRRKKIIYWTSLIEWIISYVSFIISYGEIYNKCTSACTSEAALYCHYDESYPLPCRPTILKEVADKNCTTPGWWDHVRDTYCVNGWSKTQCDQISSTPYTQQSLMAPIIEKAYIYILHYLCWRFWLACVVYRYWYHKEN